LSEKSFRIREFDDMIIVNDNEICRSREKCELDYLNKDKEMFFVLVSGILMGYFCIRVRDLIN
jgi:hypothetical protein